MNLPFRENAVVWVKPALSAAIAAMSTAPPEQWATPENWPRVLGVAVTTLLLAGVKDRPAGPRAASDEDITAAVAEGILEHDAQLKEIEQRISTQAAGSAAAFQEFRKSILRDFTEMALRVENCEGRIDLLAEMLVDLRQRVERVEAFLKALPAHLLSPELSSLRQITQKILKATSWPNPWIKMGARKMVDVFAGREEEMGQIRDALESPNTVTAVIGVAGQGKTSLITQWWEKGHEGLRDGLGVFWCRVYEPGYTFDAFLDDALRYATGETVDRRQHPATRERAGMLCAALRGGRPGLFILDGAERWLKRWAAEPDAEPEHLSEVDREAGDPVFDDFLRDAAAWDCGSRVLLTSRALPHVLDRLPHATIGHDAKQGRRHRLGDLKPPEAVELLKNFCPGGDEGEMKQAAAAYGHHPYALHVLGLLLEDECQGDIRRWREVNPLKDPDLAGLLHKALARHSEDMPLLRLVACSVGTVPVALLADLTNSKKGETVHRLAHLAKWQLVEFSGGEVDQHALVRRHLADGMVPEERKELLGVMAAWWSRRDVPANPQTIEEIRPLIRALEHALEVGDVDYATDIFDAKQSEESHYAPGEWLWRFGHLDESIRLNGRVIEVLAGLIDEGRRELRNDLASAYIGRGLALRDQGRLKEAIADYARAIEIRETLVEREGRRELRNDLASAFNNRGLALAAQGGLEEAIADYARAIEIRETLVVKEERRELRNDLASSFNNRGLALADQGRLEEAIADYARAIEITETLVEKEGRRELRNDLARSLNNRGNALKVQGGLAEAIEDYARAIEIRETLVEKEGRRELRNDLAGSFNNRGVALRAQGRLGEAIEDYARAITIYETLVEKEGRRELRNDLASAFNNRGNALQRQGRLEEAIEDFARAIAIRETLVEEEGRKELAWDFWSSLFNRALVFLRQEEWEKALGDLDAGGKLLHTRIREGRRHHLPSFLQTVGLRCRHCESIGGAEQTARWANDALRWVLEEKGAGRVTPVLANIIPAFLDGVKSQLKTLVRAGLDRSLYDRARKELPPKQE